MDFVYERRKLGDGLKIEIVTGGSHYHGKVWNEIARQIYCENGKDGFREIGHFSSGAPFLYDSDERISISHTEGCLVVATLRVKEGADLSGFSPDTSLGVDVESADRQKTLQLLPRFLTDAELQTIGNTSLEKAVIAWTCKEAMLKAYLDSNIDWHHNIIIDELPELGKPGTGHIIAEDNKISFSLHTLKEENFVISVATIKK